MIRMDFPEPDFRIRPAPQGGREVFDALRRRWVHLTPEEWVRQNVLRWMTVVMRYPPSMIAVERQIRLGSLRKKFDILVHDEAQRPWLMVECKSMDVQLTTDTLMQVLRYNMALPVPLLMITNGTHAHAISLREGAAWLDALPSWGGGA